MRLGPWDGDGEESHRSCRHLRECVTEFGAQGLGSMTAAGMGDRPRMGR